MVHHFVLNFVRIVSQFKDSVSQHNIENNLSLSPSTVHNIVKRCRESGEILMFSVRIGGILSHVPWLLFSL